MISLNLPPGRYIIAVSGGVDSMVLLDMARRLRDVELIVAHVNHGIRIDAGEDETLVHHYAVSHNIKFVKTRINLGGAVSEEAARKARYQFLQHCRVKFNAAAIITAQHQDDLIETAIINLLRGTGWRGIAPFVATANVLRPLVGAPKKHLISYAKKHNVPWREDSTNANQNYLRNYVRLSLVPRLQQRDEQWRSKFLQLIRNQQQLRRTIELELNTILGKPAPAKHNELERYMLIMAPTTVGYELLQQLLRRTTGNSLPRPAAEKILLFAKAAKSGKLMPLGAHWQLRATTRRLIVEPTAVVVS